MAEKGKGKPETLSKRNLDITWAILLHSHYEMDLMFLSGKARTVADQPANSDLRHS